jgi:hypothetical protein
VTPRERLARLAEAHAERFDPEGLRFAERLLSAGLEKRAEARLDKLEHDLAAAKAEAEEALTRLEKTGVAASEAARRAMSEGDYRLARRLASRALRSQDERPIPRWALAIAERARERRGELPRSLALRLDALTGPATTAREARDVAEALSRALYRESLSSARAALALARAADEVPDEAGPYNTSALAAQVLAVFGELSPEYTASLVRMLDELAALEALSATIDAPRTGKRRRPS